MPTVIRTDTNERISFKFDELRQIKNDWFIFRTTIPTRTREWIKIDYSSIEGL